MNRNCSFLSLAFISLLLCALACSFSSSSPTSTPLPPTSTSPPTLTFTPLPPTLTPTPLPTATATPWLLTSPYQMSNSAWIGTDGYGLACLDEAGWHHFTQEQGAPVGNKILDLALCNHEMLWIVSDAGLSATDGVTWYDYRNPLGCAPWGCGPAAAVACAGNANIWLAYYGGIARYNGNQWTTISSSEFAEGKFSELLKDIAVAPDGTVWALTTHSLSAFVNSRLERSYAPLLSDEPAEKIAIDSRSWVWVATSAGIRRVNYEGGVNLVQPRSENYFSWTSLIVDAQDRLWMGETSDGLSMMDDLTSPAMHRKATRTFTRGNSKISSDNVRALAFDDQGRAWVGTTYGLNITDGYNWTTYYMHTSELPDNSISALAVNGDWPLLPALEEKPTGSITGIIQSSAKVLKNTYIEVCVETLPVFVFFGKTPCYNQPFHKVIRTDENGAFTFLDLPIGRYRLIVQVDAKNWKHITGSPWLKDEQVLVQPGMTTDIGTIIVLDTP